MVVAMRTSGVSVALAAVLVSLVLGLGSERSSAASTCSNSQLVPALGETRASQGAPGYVRLARGKNTLVKFFLRSPTACTMANTQSIKITGATLTVDNGQQAPFTGIQTFTPYTTAPAVTAAVAANSPADPVFRAPAADLAPPANATFNPDVSGFNATFAARVTYTRVDGRTSTSGLTATFSATAIFEKRTKALRLLVVPMGDGSAAALGSAQYTAADQQATVNGLATLDRILSVPSGIDGLKATTPTGVRYVIDTTTLINLKDPSVPSTAYVNGFFCGTQASWEAIKGLLETYLNAWNRVTTNPPADRALGVVGEGISRGSDFGCAEGMASAVSHTAWVRAVSDKPAAGQTPAKPSLTGAAMAMELQHSWGQVPSPRSSTLHSSNVRPNPLVLNRSYNVDSMALVTNDHSAMKFDTTVSPPWDNTNTFDEPADFAYSSCVLGGPSPTSFNECAGPEKPGTLMGVATGHAFIASGTTNGTLAGTKVLWSQGIGQIQLTPVEPDSRYRYVRRMSAGVATNIGFHVSFPLSRHDDGHVDGDEVDSDIGQFGFALDDDIPPPGQDLATVQLWKLNDGVDPAADPDTTNATLLYERHQQAQGPQVRALSVTGLGGEENFSDNPDTDDFEPALSPDAQLLAWMEDSSGSTGTCDGPCHFVKVKPTAGGAAVYAPNNLLDSETIEPAWSPSGDELAYVVGGGDIYKVTVSFTGGSITFGPLALVYQADFDAGKLPASHPTWSPDGSEIAFAAGGNIWRIKVDGTDLIQVTTTGTAREPSWSHTSGDDRIVFVAPGDTSSDLYTLSPHAPEPSPTLLLNDGFEPYWTTSGTIAFHRGTAVWAAKSDGTGQTKLFDAAGWPTIESGYTAFQRFVGPVEFGDEEIILVRPASAKRSVTWEATGPGAQFFVSALYFRCGGYDYPVDPSVSPIGFTSTVARFRTDFDPSGACGAGGRGDLYAVATNGVQTGGDGTGDPIVTIDSPPKDPRSVISYPLEDTYRQDASFSLLGNGFSANNQALPAGNLTWSVDKGYTGTFSGSSLVLKAPAGGWPVGPLTFTLRVTEGSRSATSTRVVHILYDFVGGGFLPPVKNPPEINTGNTGSTFPLKWQLKNASGGYIRSLSTVKRVEQAAVPRCDFSARSLIREALPTGGTMLRYNTSSEQFVYNWQLPATPGCYVFVLTLQDDSEHQAWVVVSK
jgi:hypothetical protein